MESCFLRYPNFKRKALSFSYDDGVPSDKRLMEIFDRYKMKGTFNITPNFLNNWKDTKSEEETIEFYKNSGHEISAHGAKHLSLGDVCTSSAVKDVIEGRETLEKIFGKIITGMAYANGTFNDDVVDILQKCGVHYSRTTVSTLNFDLPSDWLRMPATCSSKNKNMMKLAREFLSIKDSPWFWANKPLLFLLWGHSYEFDSDNNWQDIEEFCKLLANREDIWYATNGEICDYVKAFNRLEYSVDGKIIYNPTDKDIYLCYYKKKIMIPKGGIIFDAKD